MHALEAIRTRRSYGRLDEPAPEGADLYRILEAGASAPDHGNLRPFRFTLVRDAGLDGLGEVLETAYRQRCADCGQEPVAARAAKERSKLRRAPLVIVVSAVRHPGSISWTDQRDAAVAAAQNVLLAAHALGYGAIWRTGDVCVDPVVKNALGVGEDDSIVGFLYVGTPTQRKEPRPADLSGIVAEFGV